MRKNYVFIGLLISLLFASCQKELDFDGEDMLANDSQESFEKELRLSTLRQLFHSGYTERDMPREFSLDQEDREIEFSSLQPLWSKAREFRLDESSQLQVVPIAASWAATRVADGVEGLDQATWKRYRHQINRPYLICISGNSSWKDQAYIALLVPSLEYILSGKGLDCTDGLVPRGFDGLVLLYSLQGVPLYLYGYIDGVCKTTRKYSRRSGPETLGVWDKHCYWVSYGVIEPPTKSDPEWAAGAGSKKVCKSFYVPDESDLIPPIQVQRDYITDDELGEGGGGSNGDILGDSLEGLDPESLDFVKKAFELSESQEKIKETWEAMKRHVKDSTSRCEVGRWVYRTIDEQKKIKILFGKIHVGKPRSYESSLGAAMPNIPDDPLLNDISDPNAKPICFLHTHTPVRRGLRRTSPGLTDYDMRWAQSHKSKIAVIDYVITDSGHSIDGPFFIQIYDPIIDNSEWIRDIP